MQTVISSIDDINNLKLMLARLRASGVQSLYRGQADKNWKLTCSLSRIMDRDLETNRWTKFRMAFEELSEVLKNSNILKFKPEKENEIFYLLSVARHLGFPCNLIDWTSSLDMALLAACEGNPNKDGRLFILLGNLKLNSLPIQVNPLTINASVVACKDFDFLIDKSTLSDLPLARKRRFRQNGFFSIISPKDIDVEYAHLLPKDIIIENIIIPQESKQLIMQFLQSNGITLEWVFLGETHQNPLLETTSEIISKYFKS